jgi:ABC-type Fe3+/spermidine/putrescine transport system ATPase subunit
MRGVDLEAVSLAYGSRPILREVTLRVEPAERLVLLGASGSGKSTLLRLVAGFLAPDHGVIRLGGDVVAVDGRITVPPEERRVGMVFQDLALWPHLTVYGNLAFGLKAQGIPRRERERLIQETLELVGLNTFAESKPTRLSGGEQQRVALARALVLRPDILLMDEPLSSLDDALSLQLRREIVRLHAEFGFTLLYVTHRRDEATDIASRVVRMEGGHVAPVPETSVAVGTRAGP